MRRAAKVDLMQKQIVKELRDFGAAVLHTHMLKNAFDILVGYEGRLYMVEIKNNSKGKITDGENECKETFNSVGVHYHIIWSSEQLIKVFLENRK
jgi:Holliday junction resolvase